MCVYDETLHYMVACVQLAMFIHVPQLLAVLHNARQHFVYFYLGLRK